VGDWRYCMSQVFRALSGWMLQVDGNYVLARERRKEGGREGGTTPDFSHFFFVMHTPNRILSKRLPPSDAAERRYEPPPSLLPSLPPCFRFSHCPNPILIASLPSPSLPPSLPPSLGALSEHQTAIYTRQILLGLRYLHENGIAHR
jgi:hypothetical protein